MAAKKKQKRIVRRAVATTCYFCENNVSPDYLNPEPLNQFITDRAKILGVDFSGLCAKHQRQLSVAVKRARHLGLLAFKPAL
jgi:small subunit ribosomal protein S18